MTNEANKVRLGEVLEGLGHKPMQGTLCEKKCFLCSDNEQGGKEVAWPCEALGKSQGAIKAEKDEPEMEYGITYCTEAGDLREVWDWVKDPTDQIDSDGELSIGKREWVTVLKVSRRPKVVEETLWVNLNNELAVDVFCIPEEG